MPKVSGSFKNSERSELEKKAPVIAYHYTDMNSCLEILKSHSLWLSHAGSSNDSAEVDFFIGQFKELYNRNLEDEHESKTKKVDVKELMVSNNLISDLKGSGEMPFIASFSKKGDLLSQWIGYGDKGKGVAIKFNLRPFIDEIEADTPGDSYLPGYYWFGKMEYFDGTETEWKDFINNRVDWARKKIQAKVINNSTDYGTIKKTILKNALHYKNRYFSEESELRIIYAPNQNMPANVPKNQKMAPDFRCHNGLVIPYYKIEFPTNSIEEIAIGSANKTDWDLLRQAAKQYGYQGIRISGSKSTYRPS